MRSRGSLICLVMLSLCMSSVQSAERQRLAPKLQQLSSENQRKAEAWIADLDADDYFLREKATSALAQFGSGVIPLLSNTVKNGSPEAAWRAGTALEQIALSGDEVALKQVSTAFESLLSEARPGLANVIRELANRQQWYRHTRAVEQLAKHGGQVHISAEGEEGIDFGFAEIAVEAVEEIVADADVELAEPIGAPAFEDPFSEQQVDDATRYRLAGVEPVEVSFIDQFKAKVGEALAPPEVAFAELSDVLGERIEARLVEVVEDEVEGPRLLRVELEDLAEIKAEAFAEEAIAVELEPDGSEFQSAVTIGKQWKGGDAELALLKDIRGLQMVRFEESTVTDAALTHLEKVKDLAQIYIHGGHFSPEALMKFRRQRPHVSLTARGKGMLGINATGVRIEMVQDGTPAHQAGIKKGDIVRRVAGIEVEDFLDITLTLVSRLPGDKIQVEIERSGEVHKLDVVLAERK